MKFSKTLIPTLKEIPNDCDADNISQVLMSRAGLIRRMSNGLYVYMPLMTRVMEKVEAEIRRGMSTLNCFEVKFPVLVQKEALVESGRWDIFGDNMFRIKDRFDKELALSPTNEEAACFMARNYVQSHNQLPFSLFQIQKKYRDEIRPKGGVMRTREFTMKDAYSFHANDKCLGEYFLKMQDVYQNIFANLGLKTVTVSADMGVMGGNFSREIMALSDCGTDMVGICPSCNKAENIEVLACVEPTAKPKAATNAKRAEVHTPNVKTINQLVAFLNTTADKLCKSMVYKTEKGFAIALLRGDHEINDIKLQKALGVKTLEPAEKEEAEKALGTIMGFVGPIGMKNATIIADNSVKAMQNFYIGANKADYHVSNVNTADFNAAYADIRIATDGDLCPSCKKPLEFSKAYELGHIFALGQHYTKKLELTYANQENKDELLTMGCYGIGVERTVAAIIEQHNDKNGIVWPINVAPVAVNIITVSTNDTEQVRISSELYTSLLKKGIEVIWDDRDVSPGIKFKDSDLIGIPFKIVIGKNIKENKIEITERETNTKTEIEIKLAAEKIFSMIKKKQGEQY